VRPQRTVIQTNSPPPLPLPPLPYLTSSGGGGRRPFFAEDHAASPGHNFAGAGAGKADAYFQNDGARSQRYAPFSANTGFYYLRSVPKARLLMHDLLHSYNLIAQWKSHQHVLCQVRIFTRRCQVRLGIPEMYITDP
jgi:hypothetical protein